MVAVAVDVPVVGNGTAKLEIKIKITGATDNGSYIMLFNTLFIFIYFLHLPGYMLHATHATYMLHILHATCTYMYRVLVLSTLLDGTLKLIRNVTSNFYINLSTCNSNFSLIFSL